MPIQVTLTPSYEELPDSTDCKLIFNLFAKLAALLTAHLADEDPQDDEEKYLLIMREALEDVLGTTGLACGPWSLSYAENTGVLTIFGPSNVTETMGFPVEFSNFPTEIIASSPDIVNSVGDESHWQRLPPGVSYRIPGCNLGDSDEPVLVNPDTAIPSVPAEIRPKGATLAVDSASSGAWKPKRTAIHMSIHAPIHECVFRRADPCSNSVAVLIRMARTRTAIFSMRLRPHRRIILAPVIGAPILGTPITGALLAEAPLVEAPDALAPPTGIDATNYRFFSLQQWPGTEDFDLTIRFFGDPPVLGDLTWLDRDETVDPCLAHSMPLRHLMVDDIADFHPPGSRTLEEEWAIREEWCSGEHPTPSQKAHRMMLRIDKGSLAPSMINEEVASVGLKLATRFIQRGRLIRSGSSQALEEKIPLEKTRSTREALSVIANSMHDWLIDPQGECRTIEDVRDAMGLFACGQTHVFHAHGAPNGINMFSFAELAFALEVGDTEMELDHDITFWRQMVYIFSAASQMFVHCYHRGERAVCGYKPEHNPIKVLGCDGLATPNVIPTTTLKTEVRNNLFDSWRMIGLDQRRLRFGELVYRALHEDPLINLGIRPPFEPPQPRPTSENVPDTLI